MPNELVGVVETDPEISVELVETYPEIIVEIVESGPPGEHGHTFTPDVSDTGILSWTNDGGLPNPDPIDLNGAGADKNFIFTQRFAADVWNIVHDLNKMPAVTVVDSAGSAVIGEIQYLSPNELMITFTGAFSGKAYLN